ncbi:hypothetical protein K7711_19360 [Nocardia sp. CA2R105]|uniref:hypothetical protein n=1 Tax=Nocardia coffeae TaxID=2873381 RepID=UPI001CA6EED6|nr:hypothetical protein [Nocardia coffeae]MBY8858646.1 hypothetical protein [Nocardia coffeae]
MKTLDQDKDQFVPDGMMPDGAAQSALSVDQLAGRPGEQDRGSGNLKPRPRR